MVGLLLRGNENYIRSEVANLQKPSMAHRATGHVRLLSFFKCLMALKNLQQVSELCLYDTLNLSSCLTLHFLHPEGKLFTMLNYLKNFGNAAKLRLKEENPLSGVLFYKSKFLVSCT